MRWNKTPPWTFFVVFIFNGGPDINMLCDTGKITRPFWTCFHLKKMDLKFPFRFT